MHTPSSLPSSQGWGYTQSHADLLTTALFLERVFLNNKTPFVRNGCGQDLVEAKLMQ